MHSGGKVAAIIAAVSSLRHTRSSRAKTTATSKTREEDTEELAVQESSKEVDNDNDNDSDDGNGNASDSDDGNELAEKIKAATVHAKSHESGKYDDDHGDDSDYDDDTDADSNELAEKIKATTVHAKSQKSGKSRAIGRVHFKDPNNDFGQTVASTLTSSLGSGSRSRSPKGLAERNVRLLAPPTPTQFSTTSTVPDDDVSTPEEEGNTPEAKSRTGRHKNPKKSPLKTIRKQLVGRMTTTEEQQGRADEIAQQTKKKRGVMARQKKGDYASKTAHLKGRDARDEFKMFAQRSLSYSRMVSAPPENEVDGNPVRTLAPIVSVSATFDPYEESNPNGGVSRVSLRAKELAIILVPNEEAIIRTVEKLKQLHDANYESTSEMDVCFVTSVDQALDVGINPEKRRRIIGTVHTVEVNEHTKVISKGYKSTGI
jgi:hypothetical protein